jgi:ParB family chromosome partitioning protein
MGHARALLSLELPDQMKQCRDEIVKGNLTVRAAEALVKRIKSGPKKSAPRQPDIYLSDLNERLTRHIKSKVSIRPSGKGGKIEISYGSQDELNRIVEMFSA